LSTSLKKLAGMLAAGVALSLAFLAMLPGMAEAQHTDGVSTEAKQNTTNENAGDPAASRFASEPATRLVVNPGDSLWTIGQERLGPGAPPKQVGNEAERIFKLNRERIGNDPDLILPGQELLLPPVAEPATRLVVDPGDSLWSIAQARLGLGASPEQVGNEAERIFELNRERTGNDPNLILPGQELSLTQGAGPAEDAPTTEFAMTAKPRTADPAAEEPATAEQPTSEEAVFEPEEEPAPKPATSEPAAGQPAAEDEPAATKVEPSYPKPDFTNRRIVGLVILLFSLGTPLCALAVAAFRSWRLRRRRRLLRERHEPSIRTDDDWLGYNGDYGLSRYPEREADEPTADPPVPEPPPENSSSDQRLRASEDMAWWERRR